ncbi:MAG TPA: hypothetical protein PK649_10555 [Vicingus sp.]|nr:hypothetical protein [Vicingus sp.]
MKNLILSAIAILTSLSTFANKDCEASLCANTQEINKKELNFCKEIVLTNENYKVWSFKLGYTKTNDDGTTNYIEFNGISNKIEESFLENFKTFTPEKLYLEEIIVVDENNEKFKLDNVVITVRKE